MITFACPHCEQEIQVADEAAGRKGKCTRCKESIRVPESNGQPVEQEPEDDGRQPCPHCQYRVGVPDNAMGRVGKCPQCKQRVRFTEEGIVPAEVEQPAAQPPPQPAPAAEAPVAEAPVAETPAAAPPPQPVVQDEPQWHIHTEQGQQLGPITATELNGHIQGRTISADCLLWQEGWEDWQRAGDLYPTLNAPAAAPAPVASQHDPDGFLADLGEPEPVFTPQPAAPQEQFNFAAKPKQQPAAAPAEASAGEAVEFDRRLISSLSTTRPWTIVFAGSAFILAVITLVGVIYVMTQWKAKFPVTLIVAIIVNFLEVGILVASGCFALIYNSRISQFLKNRTQPRLTSALNAQRTFWLIRSIAITISMLFAVFVLIQLIRLKNMAFSNSVAPEQGAKISATRVNVKSLENTIKLYMTERNTTEWPKNLNVLMANQDEDGNPQVPKFESFPKDAWGNRINYEPPQDGAPLGTNPKIWSNGPNGNNEQGGGDDISNSSN